MSPPITRTSAEDDEPAPERTDRTAGRVYIVRPLASIAALALFAATRLHGIADHPANFFCDEAIHGVIAERLIETGRALDGSSLPVYFRGLGNYTLSLSVWLTLPLVALLGKTITAVRATNALLTLVAVALFAATGRRLGLSRPWLVPLLAIPVGCLFVTGRTGYEHGTFLATFAVSAHAATLAFASDGRRALGWLAAMGAALAVCSYAYQPARGIAPALLLGWTGVFWLRRRPPVRWLALSVGIHVLVLLPALVFLWTSPDRSLDRFASQAFSGTPLEWPVHMLAQLARFYAFDHLFAAPPAGANPRHYVAGAGNLPLLLLPLLFLGAYRAVRRAVDSHARSSPGPRAGGCVEPADALWLLGVVIFAAPVVVMVADVVAIQRGYPVLLPVLVLAAMGVELIVDVAESRVPARLRSLGVAFVFLALGAYGLLFTRHFVETDGRQTTDYGRYGLQYGARQIYERIGSDLAAEPSGRLHVVTGLLFDAPRVFPLFFLDPSQRRSVAIAEFWEWERDHPRRVAGSRFYVRAADRAMLATQHPGWCHIATIDNPDGTPQILIVDAPRAGGGCPLDRRRVADIRSP